jgi:hypothetical protein
MIIRIPTFRPPQRYEPSPPGSRANAAGTYPSPRFTAVPRSTARGWRGTAPLVVVSLEVADHTEPERRQEISRPRRASSTSREKVCFEASAPPGASRRDSDYRRYLLQAPDGFQSEGMPLGCAAS